MNLLKIAIVIVLFSILASASKEALSPSEQTEFNIVIDNDFPDILINSPINNLQYNNATLLLVNFSVNDLTIDTIWYSLNNELNITIYESFYLALPEGEYNITIYANDSFSRTNSSNLTFIINNSAPTCPNTLCDSVIGEDCNTCPQDCGICSPIQENNGGGGGSGGGATPDKNMIPEINNSNLQEKNSFDSEKQVNTSDNNYSAPKTPIANPVQTNLFFLYLPYILIIFIVLFVILLIIIFSRKKQQTKKQNTNKP